MKRRFPMVKMLYEFWHDETGQDLGEYTLWMAFVALTSAALFISSSASVSSIWNTTNTQLSNAARATASWIYPEASPAFPDALITAPRES